MGPPRALLPVEPVAPYEPPPEIPDISMLFASAPAPAALRSFVLPLGMHRQHCRPRIARGGRVVFDRKDPITREPYFERDGGGSDGDEGDENEPTDAGGEHPRVEIRISAEKDFPGLSSERSRGARGGEGVGGAGAEGGALPSECVDSEGRKDEKA